MLSASTQTNETNSQLSAGLCNFKILVVGILPTIALLFFLATPFALGLAIILLIVGYTLHKKENPDGKVDFGNFNSLHIALKVGVIFLVVAILISIMGVACIILAVMAPIIVNILVSMTTGTSVTSSC